MLRKDYIMRQFEEFGKFLAIVFGLKHGEKWEELEKKVNEFSQKFTSMEIGAVEGFENDTLLYTLTGKHQLKEAQLKMLADLLYEKGIAYEKQLKETESVNALRKALLIYVYVRDNSLESDFSLDMHLR